jgi:hypothetical protein
VGFTTAPFALKRDVPLVSRGGTTMTEYNPSDFRLNITKVMAAWVAAVVFMSVIGTALVINHWVEESRYALYAVDDDEAAALEEVTLPASGYEHRCSWGHLCDAAER